MPDIKNVMQPQAPRFITSWMPVMVGILLCILSGLLGWTLELREQANMHMELQNYARQLGSHIDADLRNRIPTLRRMAGRWEIRGGTPKNEFVMDASAYFNDVGGFQALEWVDKSGIVRWIVPLEGNEQAQDKDLGNERERRRAMERARNSRSAAMTGPVELFQGGKGFLIFFPVHVRGDSRGFILAVFRTREWLEYVFSVQESQVLEDFQVSVFLDDVLIYRQAGWEELENSTKEAQYNSKLMEHLLSIHIRPTHKYLNKSRTILPGLTSLLGIIMSVLLAFIVYLLQKTYIESWELRMMKSAMEAKIGDHKKTQDELHRILARLDLATKAGGIGVWSWDITSNRLQWNERMYELYDTPPDVMPTYETWSNALHPDDRAAAESMLKNAVEGRAAFNTEFRIVLTTGSLRYLGAAARVERDDQGRPMHVTGINWDLTARKTAEETMKKSEEQVRLLLNSTAEAIYGIDVQGKCTFANPSCLRMLEYDHVDQLLGKNMHELIHHSYPDGAPMPMEKCWIYRAFREGTGSHRDDEVLWKRNGKSFPAEYWSFPQVMNGEVTGAVVTFTDITERRQSEAKIAHYYKQEKLIADISQLLNSPSNVTQTINEVLRMLGEHTGVCRIYIFEDVKNGAAISNTYEWCNNGIVPQKVHLQNMPYDRYRSGKELLLREGRIIAESLSQLPEDLQKIVEPRGAKSIIIYPIYVESFLYGFMGFDDCRSGRIWTDEEIELLRTLSGVISHTFERKLFLEKIESSEIRLQLALESANEGLWDWNMETGQVFYNDICATMMGYKPEELEPTIQGWKKMVHPDDTQKIEEIFRKHLAGELKSFEIIYRARTKEGVWRWILDHGMVVQRNENNQPVRAIGIHIDVTEQKEIEQKLQESIKTKDKLFSIIAHDLRGPIGNFMPILEILTSGEEMDEKTRKELLEGLVRSTKNTFTLLENLLNWSKSQADAIALKPASFILNEVIDENVELLSSLAQQKAITITVKTEAKLSAFADRDSVTLVIRNLLSNAIKFTPNKGTIAVSAQRINGRIEVTVRDSGVGMKKSVVENLFKSGSFYSTRGTNNEKGAGIGLMLCRDFVERNGGHLRVESVPGEGSSFVFTIPEAPITEPL